MHKLIGGFILAFSLASGWLWIEFSSATTRPVVSEPTVIEINRGDSFNKITRNLQANNVSIKPVWFKLLAYKNNVQNKLKAGEYQLSTGMSATDILVLFSAGKTRQYAITFAEGLNFKEFMQVLASNPNIIKTLDNANSSTIIKQLKLDHVSLEGLLFPETYFFDKNTTDIALLLRAYAKMQQVLTEEWQRREDGLPLKSPYQALILASIVEKETGATQERPQIAGVFIRRLRIGMRLQTDPTVIYGMGDKYHGNIRRKDLRKPTAYNTYTIKGLPPTPIAMPGREAIHAVLHPSHDNSLYFVARGGGRHVFSSNLKDHNRAVNKYQRKRQ